MRKLKSTIRLSLLCLIAWLDTEMLEDTLQNQED
jgi:hypothetical protein